MSLPPKLREALVWPPPRDWERSRWKNYLEKPQRKAKKGTARNLARNLELTPEERRMTLEALDTFKSLTAAGADIWPIRPWHKNF